MTKSTTLSRSGVSASGVTEMSTWFDASTGTLVSWLTGTALELHVEALGIFVRQHPCGAAPCFAATGGVFDQPRRVGENGDAQHAGLLDRVRHGDWCRARGPPRRRWRRPPRRRARPALIPQRNRVFIEVPPDRPIPFFAADASAAAAAAGHGIRQRAVRRCCRCSRTAPRNVLERAGRCRGHRWCIRPDRCYKAGTTNTAPESAMSDTDVLIAGAGPTGLVLALWPSPKNGVRVRIVDKVAGARHDVARARRPRAHARALSRDSASPTDVVARKGLRFRSRINLWVRSRKGGARRVSARWAPASARSPT